MQRKRIVIIAGGVVLLLLMGIAVYAKQEFFPGDMEVDEVNIVLKEQESAAVIQEIAQKYHAVRISEKRDIGMTVYKLKLPIRTKNRLFQVIAEIESDNRINYATPTLYSPAD